MNPLFQDEIQGLLDQLVTTGPELGLQAVAFHDGACVVDACAGNASRAAGDRVTPATLFPVFSTTKGIAATLLHRLVERRGISYDTRVAELWPEFAAHGKSAVTLRHSLGHSAGIPFMPTGIGYPELCDWDCMVKAIAALPPQWPPGARTEYHAMTFGWIVGELAQRLGGKSFAELLRVEIREPLGLSGLFVGLPRDVTHHVAVIEEDIGPFVPADDTVPQSVPGWIGPLHAMMNRPDIQHACIPGSNGLMTARALATHYAALLPGGSEGRRLLSDERIGAATIAPAPYAPAWGLGYQLGGAEFYRDSGLAFGHGGYGSSLGVADRELNLAIGITKNRFVGGESTRLIVETLRRLVLGKINRRAPAIPSEA